MVDDPDNDPPPALDSSAPSRAAGHFELLREIGSGSSGTVYQARLTRAYADLTRGSEIAVKFLRPELAQDRKARRRLDVEGKLGQSVRHRNVARIYGVETVELLGLETTFLLMQYVRGTTLRELLQRSGTPVEDLVRRLGAHAAHGLAALHAQGLVHRDIKPDNLILTPDSELKIVDLGLARPFGGARDDRDNRGSGGSNTSGHGLAGSVAYTAPEVLRGQPPGPAGDLYALGVVLFEVTCGQHPFADANNADEMLYAHLYRVPPRPSHLRTRVSPLLEQVLLELLQKAPEDRPRHATELARRLEQGERSEWWQRHERNAPVLASTRRLQRMRRPADTAFVDRRVEAATLDEHFAAALQGRGSTLAVVAPESSGRRRLLDESIQRWLEGPTPPRLLGGDADAGLGHGEPFASSLIDLLLRGDERHSPNARARARAAADERFGLRGDEAQALVAAAFGDSTEPSEVRADRIADALLRLPTAQRALVLRIDRADELDTTGRRILQRLVSAAATRHLLVLLAAGPDASLPEPIARLELGGLEPRAFARFGAALFRQPLPSHATAFLDNAHQMLSGLPGSLLEALEHLVSLGQLRGRIGDYHQLDTAAEPRPAPKHVARFRQRVQSLEPAHRQALSAAAVLGDRCRLDDLAAVILEPEIAVLEALSLFRGRIVHAQGGEVWFRHRDFRTELLRTLAADDRQRLHAAAAAVLEARGAGVLEVGMHRSMALDHQGCLDPLLQALADRVRAGSRRTAMRLSGRIEVHLRHVDASDANRRRRMQLALLTGQANQQADQPDAAAREFRLAERMARELGDLESSAAARLGLANGDLDAGRMLSALALLEVLHDDLQDDRLDNERSVRRDTLAAEAHALHGRILLYLGQSADCMKQLLAAKKRVPDDDDDLRCHLWIDLARGEALAHRYATALRTLQQIEKAEPVLQQPRARLRLHLYRGQIRAILGDPMAGQDLRRAEREASRLALPVYAARAALFLGERAFWRGRDDEAIPELRLAAEHARSAGDRIGEAMARAHLLRLGDADESLSELVQTLDLPEVTATLLLARAGRGDDADELDELLEQLLANVDLPLPLHLRALTWLERPASGRSLVRAVAARLPSRQQRQRFLRTWQDRVRV